MRILFANDYPMDLARRGWYAGVYPNHHLYGTEELTTRTDVTLVDIGVSSPEHCNRLNTLTGNKLGDITKQVELLQVPRDRQDVIFSARLDVVRSLLGLRLVGLLRTPLVVTLHHWSGTRADRILARGADAVISLSAAASADLLVDTGIDPTRVTTLGWGPDLDFAGYRSAGDCFILSVGKTQRDLSTLVAALEGIDFPARIHVAENSDIPVGLPEWITLVQATRPRTEAMLSYASVLPDIQRAAIFAIPLVKAAGAVGLTELNDALALGKPVVMTRNPYVGIDIESIGCGIWVDQGDVAGWAAALRRLVDDSELRAIMGARGRKFAEEKWNSRLFAAGAETVLRSALTSPRPPWRSR